jgi:hypothetical protein
LWSADVSTTVGCDHVVNRVIRDRHPFAVHFDFALPLLDRWPKRSESLFRANRLVARNPLRRELARQRDISYGPSGTWNRGAAFRISEMSGQSHPPKPPVLGRKT